MAPGQFVLAPAHSQVRPSRVPPSCQGCDHAVASAFQHGVQRIAPAFVMLILSLEVTTSSARIQSLMDERARVVEQIRTGETDMSRLGREPAVRRRAFELGIGQLTDPLIVEER